MIARHGYEALKPPRLVRLAPNFYVAACSIMKLYPAAFIIRQAEARKIIGPDTLVVETTSGTFGLALAMVCAERGHRLALVGDGAIDETLRERIVSLGADISIVTEPAAVGGMQRARLDRLAELRCDNPDHFWPAQYENPGNGESYAELAALLAQSVGAIDLPPAEWPRDYDSLDHERDDRCHSRSTSRKRSSGSCVKLRSCWRRGHRLPKRVGGSLSASKHTTAGARNMVV